MRPQQLNLRFPQPNLISLLIKQVSFVRIKQIPFLINMISIGSNKYFLGFLIRNFRLGGGFYLLLDFYYEVLLVLD
jgi:hypothetical protein